MLVEFSRYAAKNDAIDTKQITAIPEPATVLFFALGTVALIRKR